VLKNFEKRKRRFKMKVMNVAVVGEGIYGINHVNAYTWNPNTNLVAVCDLNKEITDRIAEQYNVKTYNDVNEMLHTWEGDLEIVSIGGNINTMNGETYTHFHISVADEAGNVYGGHLTEAVISGTGELVLTEIEGTVDRKFDEEIGLNLFEF